MSRFELTLTRKGLMVRREVETRLTPEQRCTVLLTLIVCVGVVTLFTALFA